MAHKLWTQPIFNNSPNEINNVIFRESSESLSQKFCICFERDRKNMSSKLFCDNWYLSWFSFLIYNILFYWNNFDLQSARSPYKRQKIQLKCMVLWQAQNFAKVGLWNKQRDMLKQSALRNKFKHLRIKSCTETKKAQNFGKLRLNHEVPVICILRPAW